jgi:hypothetical protein
MMRLILALVFGLAAAAPAAPAPLDLGPEETALIAAFLDKNYSKPRQLLIENEAVDAWFKNRRAWEAYLLGRITGPGRASDACLRAFLSRPERQLRIFKFPATKHSLRFVRSDELNKMQSKGGWEAFYAAYPGVNGFLSFGAPAFGPDKDEALFTVKSSCGKKCGYRDIVYMQKLNGNWEIVIKESLP